MTDHTDDPEFRRQLRTVAGLIHLVAQRDGLAIDEDEIEAALVSCHARAHGGKHDNCDIVALIQRKAQEQGVTLARHLGEEKQSAQAGE